MTLKAVVCLCYIARLSLNYFAQCFRKIINLKQLWYCLNFPVIEEGSFFLWLWFPPSIPFVGKLRQKSFCQCRGKYLWGTEQIQLFFIWKYTRQLPKQFTFLSIFIFSIGSGHVMVRGDPKIHSIRKFWALTIYFETVIICGHSFCKHINAGKYCQDFVSTQIIHIFTTFYKKSWICKLNSFLFGKIG